jgi:hypothetical protein
MANYKFKVSKWNRETKKFDDITSELKELKNFVIDTSNVASQKAAGKLALTYALRGYHVCAYEDVDRESITIEDDW